MGAGVGFGSKSALLEIGTESLGAIPSDKYLTAELAQDSGTLDKSKSCCT